MWPRALRQWTAFLGLASGWGRARQTVIRPVGADGRCRIVDRDGREMSYEMLCSFLQ